MKKIQKLLAFTLAETLIVMGIIGVVAALTIPNLNSSTADKEKVAKLKKVYSNLQDAIGRTEAVYGNMSEWQWSNIGTTTDAQLIAERMGDFLKVSKTCGFAVNSGCLPKTGKDLNGTNWSGKNSKGLDNTNEGYKYVLADGTGLSISAASGAIFFVVDIDGPIKGASTLGKDLFEFYVISPSSWYLGDQIKNTYGWQLISDNPFNTNSLLTGKTDLSANFKTGDGLATWVLQTDNMDYLKATNGTCKNGKVLSWTNTSCK